MAKRNSALSRRHVLALIGQDDMKTVNQVLAGEGTDAVVCADVPDLASKMADNMEAAIISWDLLSENAFAALTAAIDAQPEWSDFPIILAVSGGADSPVSVKAVRDLGNVSVISYPFTPAALKNTLLLSFRSRERQRWIRDLSKECELTMQALQESRDSMEQKVEERTSELAERASQLRALTGELIMSEQRERRRMARILHDNLQQLLVSIKYRVGSLRRNEDPGVKVAIEETEELLSEAIEATRSLTSELSPPIVHESGLRTGMEWLVSYMGAQNGLEVRLRMEDDFQEIDKNTRIMLFESTRELLLNVVKHAQVKAADVEIRRAGEKLQLTVQDRGVGFDPASRERMGIGLSKIRERLQLIGGQLDIESSAKKGSRISIVLPLEESGRQAASAPVDAKAQKDRPFSGMIRVLIADDHAVMRQGLSTSLKQEPDIVIVGEAENGKIAIDKARTLSPDVVLMDLGMPKMSGIEATRIIHSEMPQVRVIGLSMFEEKERANAMIEAGAVAYLSKSCSVDSLTSAIRRSIGKPRMPAGIH